jgi:hypothetical protein
MKNRLRKLINNIKMRENKSTINDLNNEFLQEVVENEFKN